MISLTISLSNIEFEKDTLYDKNNTVCTVFLNGTSIDKLYATQNDDRTNLSLNKSSDKVQLVIQTKDNSELIGCISLNYDHFVNLTEKEFSQWFSLSNSLEEDEFKGTFGENDTTTPRILLSFTLENSVLSNQGAQTSTNLSNNQVSERENRSQFTGNVKDTNIMNLDGRMRDLMGMLNKTEQIDSQFSEQRNQKFSNPTRFEETRELLELEIKKSKMLEESLKQAELQLRKQEVYNGELEMKTQSQFKQLSDKNKFLNEDNFNLKQRIAGLEAELNKIKQNYVKELENVTREHSTRSEDDKSNIEKYTITIQNLERVNEDLSTQLEKMRENYNQEKELNKQMQKQMEENLASNKKNLALLREKTQSYFEQIQTLTEEKAKLEFKYSNTDLQLQNLEVKKQSLEAENESFKQELEKMWKEVQSLKDTNTSLKQSIEDITARKDKDILDARENVLKLEENVRRIRTENEFLAAEKREVDQQLANLKQMNYENRITNLDKALANSEEARKSLQAQLQQSETRIQGYVQQQKDKGFVSKAYEETIQELREKNKDLLQKIDDMNNLVDQIKYENIDLKLKLDEYSEVNEQNLRLKGKLNSFKEDNYKLKDSTIQLRHQLFNTSTELIRQTNIALEECAVIQDLDNQMQTLDSSLRTAFGDIRRMHFTLEAANRLEAPYNPYIPLANDEVDQEVSEFINSARLPIRFARIRQGFYTFGSKTVQMKMAEGKLLVQYENEDYSIEEFVRLNAQSELFKTKGNKEDTELQGERAREASSSPDRLLNRSPNRMSPRKRVRTEEETNQQGFSIKPVEVDQEDRRSPEKNVDAEVSEVGAINTDV